MPQLAHRSIALLALLCWGCFLLRPAPLAAQDSLSAAGWLQQAEQLLEEGRREQAQARAEQALQVADRQGLASLKGLAHYWLGQSLQNTNPAGSLNQYLQALYAQQQQASEAPLARTCLALGRLYERQALPSMAAGYYAKALSLEATGEALRGLARAEAAAGRPDEALEAYRQLEPAIPSISRDQAGWLYAQMALLSHRLGRAADAAAYGMQAAAAYEQAGLPGSAGQAYNNLGFALQESGDAMGALRAYAKAVAALQQEAAGRGGWTAYINLGVAHERLGQPAEARTAYRKAYELAQRQGDTEAQAQACNYWAAGLFVAGSAQPALEKAREAMALAEAHGHEEALAASLEVQSEVLRSQQRFKDSQRLDRQRQELESRLSSARALREQERLQALLEAQRRESEFLALIADKERQALGLRQLGLQQEKLLLEKEALEKEQAALRSQQELQEANLRNQRLEGERVKQALLLAQRQLDAEQQRQQIAQLQAMQERQRLELAQKELEEKERQKAIALLESDRKLQQERLEKEEAGKRFSYWLLGLSAVIFALMAVGFVQQRRASRKLRLQAAEIVQKNEELQSSEEELRQNMEELETTQEHLRHQNERLESTYGLLATKNEALTSSIRYAETIQMAILPSAAQLAQAFREHFVLYLPKDLVSGDFYWMSRQEGTTFVAVADCTGHGVPGAFMSMIGSSLLNQYVNEKRMRRPEKVLDALNAGIVQALRQHDSDNSDGMDIALCRLDWKPGGGAVLHFSGAKSKLIRLRADGAAEVLKSDNLAIGGAAVRKKADASFTCQTLDLEPGECLMLLTDGYGDTANAQRKRLGTPRLVEALEARRGMPLPELGEELRRLLEAHRGEEPQRDDITLLALRI